MPPFEIMTSDVLEWAAAYDGPLFHALLCDPPYHFTSIARRFGKPGSAPAKHGSDGAFARASAGFMGQTWDGGDVAFRPETWAAFMPLLYPGAFGMAFASARGWHRLAAAIEDAGYIIHPSIFGWVHAMGFPKATRIDTQIDRAAGAERPIVGEVTYHGHNAGSGAGSFSKNQYEGMAGIERTEPLTAPVTDLAKTWEHHRYGLQAMKPALEPIIVFQKPYEGRPVDDITRTGAGALNIDGGRLDGGGGGTACSTRDADGHCLGHPSANGSLGGGTMRHADIIGRAGEASAERTYEQSGSTDFAAKLGPRGGDAKGRWPANFVLVHTPECRKIGTTKAPTGTAVGGKHNASGSNAIYAKMERKPNQGDDGYADADGMETVDVWECANDCPVLAFNQQAGERASSDGAVKHGSGSDSGGNAGPAFGKESRPAGTAMVGYGDTGPASRFYLNADWSDEVAEGIFAADVAHFEPKADVEERERGLRFVVPCAMAGKPNVIHRGDPLETETHFIQHGAVVTEVACRRNAHPTIKPLALIRWLATLLLPPPAYAPRRILVPFAGAGSECIGAKQAGWEDVVGVELHEAYAALARIRLAAYIGML